MTNALLNRPMLLPDLDEVVASPRARELRQLVADYGSQGLPIANGNLRFSNLREGRDQALTCHPYRLWEYTSLFLAEDTARPWSSALDVGGAGSPLPYLLASRGIRTRAIDLQPLLVALCGAVAAARHLPLDAVVEDVTADSSDATTYDLVTFISVLEHIPPRLHGRTFEALHRKLVPGGLLYVTFDYGAYVEYDAYRNEHGSEVEASSSIRDVASLCAVIEGCGFEFVGNDPRALPQDILAARHAPSSREVYLRSLMTIGPVDGATSWRTIAGYLSRRLLGLPRPPMSRFDQHNFFRMFLRKRE